MSGFPESDHLLGRKEIERALEGLSQALAQRGVRAHLYVIGGAAMLLAHRRSRATMDVDALSIDPRDEVLACAAQVSRDQHLSAHWLNDYARTIMPAHTPDTRAPVVFESPSLVVTGASARHVLAMKVRAGRDSDGRDIELLIQILGISSMQHVEAIHRAVYPHDDIPERSIGLVQRCLDRIRRERARDDGEIASRMRECELES